LADLIVLVVPLSVAPQVITPFRILMLAAESRTVMDDWVHAIRVASDAHFYEVRKYI
jgi:hypothetical protein